MSHNLVTIASFSGPIEANLARNRLAAGGITGILAGEEVVTMVWAFTNTVGGIRLQVEERDTEAAVAALERNAEEPWGSDVKFEPTGEADDEEPPPTPREASAERAYRAAFVAILFLPLQLYTFWLLIQVYLANEPMRPQYRRQAVVASWICLPFIVLFCLFFYQIVIQGYYIGWVLS